jgi:hypothetical protein
MARQRLNMAVEVQDNRTDRGNRDDLGDQGSGGSQNTVLDPAKFMTRKRPATDVERIASLAYLLKRAGTREFSTRDLSKMNTRAAGADFSNASFAARNAARAGLLAKAGGGKKQISSLGEMVVDALPDREAVKQIFGEHGRPKRKGARRKRTSKAQ